MRVTARCTSSEKRLNKYGDNKEETVRRATFEAAMHDQSEANKAVWRGRPSLSVDIAGYTGGADFEIGKLYELEITDPSIPRASKKD